MNYFHPKKPFYNQIGLKNRTYMTAGNSIFTLGAVINVGGNRKKNNK